MEPITYRLVFLRALLTHVDRLRDLLGVQWLDFRDRLQALLDDLVQAKDDDHVLLLVDALIDAGLESPAAELVRDLLRQARAAGAHCFVEFDCRHDVFLTFATDCLSVFPSTAYTVPSNVKTA
jgi:hypothetical protein